MLPVPLNSSKMTSSILEPVSIRAEARMVKRAAVLDVARGAQKLLRRIQRRGVDATGKNAAAGGLRQIVGASQTRDGVEQDHDVLTVLDQALRALDDQLGDTRCGCQPACRT